MLSDGKCRLGEAEHEHFAWFRDIFFVDQNKGWIVGSDGVMLSTEDGGQTWVQTRKFTTDAFLQIYFTNETTGWLLCERNIYARGANATSYLRKTTDGGRTWDTRRICRTAAANA